MAAAGTCDPCLRGHLAHGRNQSLAGPRAPASRPSRRLCVARVGAMDASPSAPEAAWSTTPVRRGVLSLPPLPKSGNASQDLAVLMAAVADQLKAADTVVLHVEPLVSWTSYMVIVTVTSRPQLLAVQYRCREVAREVAGREAQEGKPGKSEWELIDFGDVVVSVMTPEQREYYDLESFYGQAEEIDLPF